MKKLFGVLLLLAIAVAVFIPNAKVNASTALDEIVITGSESSIVPGDLPAFTVQTTTAHASIQPYGSNTTWMYWGEGHSSWHGFGSSTPSAEVDTVTHYAMRLCVELDDDYVFTDQTKIYYNNYEIESTYRPVIDIMDWGAYIYIDLGLANPPDERLADEIQIWGANGGEISASYVPSEPNTLNLETRDGTIYVHNFETVGIYIGDELTVHARPEEGFRFVGWKHLDAEYSPGSEEHPSPCVGEVISSDPSYTYRPSMTTIDGDEYPLMFVCADFEEDDEIEPRPQKEYKLESADKAAKAIFTFDEGFDFQLNFVDVLTLSAEELENDYGVPASYVEEAKKFAIENVKKYGDLISLYAITIDDGPYGYSDALVLKIKMTPAMKKYNKFKFVFLDENNDFSVEEVHDVKIEGDYLVINDLTHLSAYALVGKYEESGTNPKTSDLIMRYVLLFGISSFALMGLGLYKKKENN